MSERRRNMRPDVCRGCGAAVEAEAGFLYRDTNSRQGRSRFNRTGRFGWVVKCERCHTGETARDARRQEAESRGKRWSPREIDAAVIVEAGRYAYTRFESRRGVVRVFLPVCGAGFEETSEPCVWVIANGERTAAAYCDLIHGRFGVHSDFGQLDPLGGRELTAKAADRLNERVLQVAAQLSELELAHA